MYPEFRTKYEIKNRLSKERPVRQGCRMFLCRIGYSYYAFGFL